MDRGSGRGRRTLLAVVCAVAVSTIYAAQPVLERMGTDLGLSAGGLGWVVGVGQLGYLAGLILLVPLGDLLDRRRLMACHLTLAALGTGLVAVTEQPAVALIGLAVAGVFAVVVQIAVAYAAATSAAPERGRDIGVVTSGVVIGILGGRVLAGLLADLAGWRGIYLTLTILSLALAAAVLAVLPPDARRSPRDRDGRRGGARRYARAIGTVGRLTATDRLFRGRALIAFFLFASFGTLWSGIALPLSAERWQLSTTQIGLFGLAGLAGALGAARAGRWADRGRSGSVTGWSLAVLIASWGLTALTGHSLWSLGAGIVLLDFAVQAVHVTSQQLITAARPDRASGTIGAYMVFYSLGSGLGAVTTTWAYDAAGWAAASVLGAGYATAALVIWALHRRPHGDIGTGELTATENTMTTP
ncbi:MULTISPECIES: MFS transporter [Streptosporangium]|uniref:MFS family arabinose efflux permease n=1 Tax=Streptosporangium brasiliense TaxID=47480 RepID=A0ABT9QZU0_9ACTN|nr:MFS transporter [Streptosporangium brasiliense]MDP9862069.1 putative MFS family arabinose efflux permease [Streptosporangium brasiliense]